MCLVDDAGLVAIAAAEWSACKVLDLHGNEIGAAGVGELAKSPVIQRLEQLDLTGNPIGDEGMALLAQSGVLGRAMVKVGHRGFTDAAAEAILAAGNVRRLVLDFVVFSEEMTARLKATFGDRVAVPE